MKHTLYIIIASILLVSCHSNEQQHVQVSDIKNQPSPKEINMHNTGIITKKSELNFDDTYNKLRSIIDNNPNLTILFELDHQANAAKVDLELAPTKIIFFGNPKLGTPLMIAGDKTGLDLPQKILVTERNGEVSISYNDPSYLKDRHNISDKDEVLAKVTGALDKITTMASKG